jgi:hypothetical protein
MDKTFQTREILQIEKNDWLLEVIIGKGLILEEN